MPIIRVSSFDDPKETLMRCPNCKSDTYVEITMALGDNDVAFRRCGRCETQKWESEEQDIDLTSVLAYAKNLQV